MPENVQKKLNRDKELAKAKEDRKKKEQQERADKRKKYIANAAKYLQEYKEQERALIDSKRQARANNQFYMEAEPRVAFAIRIKGINKLAPQPRKILQLMRLRQLHNGAFIKLNKATIGMLRRVEPNITYGYLNRKTVSDMIYKRGHIKVHGMRVPIQSNEHIEAALGKFGIMCVEDLIHEIVTCGPHFKEANSLLWPFKLSPPRGGFNTKRHPYQQGGDWGNREEFMNDLVRRML